VSDAAPLVEQLVPVPDPLETCARFTDHPFLLFLDSAGDRGHLGRYSFLAADPFTAVRAKGLLTQQLVEGRWVRVDGDPLARVEALLEPFGSRPLADVPPFQGGAAGYIGYDWGAALERVPRARYDDLAVPDVLLGLYDWVIAWEHETGRAWVISTGMPERGAARERRAAKRLALVKQRVRGLPPRQKSTVATGDPARVARTAAPSYPVPDVPGLRSNFTREGYLDAVARVIDYIRAGDIFQANLSQRLEASLLDTPLALYERLRRRNPAPFAAFLDYGDVVVASSSPERFLRVLPDGRVETRPIKGTRPRGVGPEHDAALALALSESEKDRAENVMIVDLLRNDLSRVCRPGTVRAPLTLFASTAARMSLTSVDLPDPDTPVTAIMVPSGNDTSILRRLCSRAPTTVT
jgi:para-aminobenzoate synthetase component 1